MADEQEIVIEATEGTYITDILVCERDKATPYASRAFGISINEWLMNEGLALEEEQAINVEIIFKQMANSILTDVQMRYDIDCSEFFFEQEELGEQVPPEFRHNHCSKTVTEIVKCRKGESKFELTLNLFAYFLYPQTNGPYWRKGALVVVVDGKRRYQTIKWHCEQAQYDEYSSDSESEECFQPE